MKFHLLYAGVISASLAFPLAAQAQGIPDGIHHGASVGMQAAGPLGGFVGGVVGGVIGGVNGALGITPAAYPGNEAPVARHPRHHHHAHKDMAS